MARLALAGLVWMPAALLAQPATMPSPQSAWVEASRWLWRDVETSAASAVQAGNAASPLPARRFRTLTLDRAGLRALLVAAPSESALAGRPSPLVLSLPDPAGGFQRFRVADSPVMEPELAARHPEIRTYAGRGIDDPTATMRLSLTPLGLQVSVRSVRGAWLIDSLEGGDGARHASYWRRDATPARSPLAEPFVAQPRLSSDRGRYRDGDTVVLLGSGFAPHQTVVVSIRRAGQEAPRQVLSAVADDDGSLTVTFRASPDGGPNGGAGAFEAIASDGRHVALADYRVVTAGESVAASTGTLRRVYRLALLSDPAYANHFGTQNVTAAKVALINRVTQIYEDETSIRLVLVAGTERLNLDTPGRMTGANGPCGGSACFSASQASGCSSSTLSRTRQVIGLLVGASGFDIGHLLLGGNGGGFASTGVVGAANKAQGCSGLNPPTGDALAVDFLAHEMGHQFGASHSFNGTQGSCTSGNRSPAGSVEPGSGSTVMSYAGICGSDNLQPNADAVWSQRSFDEIAGFVQGVESLLSEVQQAVLSGFGTDGMQFRLRWAGMDSVPIVRGSNFHAAGVQAAIESTAGWPAGATAVVTSLGDTGFTVTFGGSLAGLDVGLLEIVGASPGIGGFVSDIVQGGPTLRGGATEATGNHAPTVSVPAPLTIPVRTPFQLSGSASDADGDALTYLWEQVDRGGTAGAALTGPGKTQGPLFRVFGTRALVDAGTYDPAGQNTPGASPLRVFPDLAQLLANNTNADTGSCPSVLSPPSAANTDCFSEWLPTAAYVGTPGVNASPARLNFRLTARDGRGGVHSATTTLTLAPAAGPFRVTAPDAAVTLDGAQPTTVQWSVAGTNLPPVGVSQVRILLSTDGGFTWPRVLHAGTANDGNEVVTLPNIATALARIRVEAVGNVFFDVSNASFTIRLAGDADGNGRLDCNDIALIGRHLGLSAGQLGYVAAYDVNRDGVINAADQAYVQKRLPRGTTCTPRRR